MHERQVFLIHRLIYLHTSELSRWRHKRCGFDDLGRSPRVGNDNQLQYSCLESSINKEVWQATQSMGPWRVGHNWATEYTDTLEKKKKTPYFDFKRQYKKLYSIFHNNI